MKNQTKLNSLILISIILINSTMLGNSRIPEQEIQNAEIKSEDMSVDIGNDVGINVGIEKMNIVEVEEKEEVKKLKYKEVNLVISHYSSLAEENGGFGAVDAQGSPLSFGCIAIPRDLPLGTKFIIDGYDGEFIGRDRGNRKYIKWIDDNTMKIDLFIPRNSGESDSAYRKRLMKLGIKKTTGRYLLESGE